VSHTDHTFRHTGSYKYRIAPTFVKPRGGKGQNGRLKCPLGLLVMTKNKTRDSPVPNTDPFLRNVCYTQVQNLASAPSCFPPTPPPSRVFSFCFTPCPKHPTALKGGRGTWGNQRLSYGIRQFWLCKSGCCMRKSINLINFVADCDKWKRSSSNAPFPITFTNSVSRHCCLPTSFPYSLNSCYLRNCTSRPLFSPRFT